MNADDDATLNDATLRDLAQRLGERAGERVNVERVAQGVVAGLRQPDVRPHGRPRAVAGWLRVAAALLVLVGGAFAARQVLSRAPTHFVHEDLAGLDAAELSELLDTLDQTLDLSRPAPDDDLDDLSESQLEAILRSLEG